MYSQDVQTLMGRPTFIALSDIRCTDASLSTNAAGQEV
jgi:hypothetical protein